MSKPRIYVASPLGFAGSTRPFMADLIAALDTYANVENPWDDVRFEDEFASLASEDSVSKRDARLKQINHELGKTNAERIDASDAVFAILDGVDVDSGTAAEIGYAAARGKYICGLRTDFRLAGDNAGAIVNLQVEFFIHSSGGKIVTTADELVELARDIASRSQP